MGIASLASDLIDSYNHLMVNYRDSRVDDFFLMSSPLPTLLICAGYIYFVKYLGPRLMRDRPPFQLKNAIIVYNIIQIVFSTYLVYKFLVHAWLWRYSWRCQPVNFSYDQDELIIVQSCSWYFYCKLFEFLDTVFFVLRKKMDQVTHLHIIHHTIMATFSWLGVRFLPTGHGTFFVPINSFVHVIMYSYYLLSAMGPEYQKFTWWKKHLTTIQMIQFVAIFIHSIQLFFNGCDYPHIIAYILCMNAALFMVLFSNFYIQAYIKRRRLPQAKKESSKGKEDSSTIENAKMVFKKTITAKGILSFLSLSRNRDLLAIHKEHPVKNKTC